jgi:hypothetical protein
MGRTIATDRRPASRSIAREEHSVLTGRPYPVKAERRRHRDKMRRPTRVIADRPAPQFGSVGACRRSSHLANCRQRRLPADQQPGHEVLALCAADPQCLVARGPAGRRGSKWAVPSACRPTGPADTRPSTITTCSLSVTDDVGLPWLVVTFIYLPYWSAEAAQVNADMRPPKGASRGVRGRRSGIRAVCGCCGRAGTPARLCARGHAVG